MTWSRRNLLQPPRSLFVALLSMTALATGTLAWLGWRLVTQEREIEAQRERARLEMSVRSVAAAWKARLAEWNATGSWPPRESPAGAVALRFSETTGLQSYPGGRVLYLPFVPPSPEDTEAPEGVFADAERLEIRQENPAAAASEYARLARSNNPAVAAGANLRLARCLRRTGRSEEATRAYEALARAPREIRVAGTPAQLIGFDALDDARRVRQELERGRWLLSRGQFFYYWSRAAARLGQPELPPADLTRVSEAAAGAWRAWIEANGASEGERTLPDGYQLLWRGRSGYLIPAGTFEAEARSLFPRAEDARSGTGAFLFSALGVIILFLLAGSYFVARAIRREMEVARLKQDFVSAVSHEFRTPLTAIRQFAEILAANRVPNEERKQRYYAGLLEQSSKLQRLVETLLNFGGMESGARRYRMQAVELRGLIEQVASEFPAGTHRIECAGPPDLWVDADPEALGVAVRNLIDNAIKYSPGATAVWVEWRLGGGGCAEIDVRDEGVGIPKQEQALIFQKFVRGSAAAETQAGGSGVGLAMVQQIAHAHRAGVRVESEQGKGSTFRLVLPLAETARGTL